MKNISIILLCAALSGSVMSGCTRASSSASTAATYRLTATAGSTAINCGSCIGGLSTGALGITGSTLTGTAGGPPQINIAVNGWTGGTGTYALGATKTGIFAEYITAIGAIAQVSQSGSITITSVSSTAIAGTFNFTCSSGTVISGGTFNAQRF